MVAWKYGISLLVFNSTSHEWGIEFNKRRDIPYLRVPMYYSLFYRYVYIWNLQFLVRKSLNNNEQNQFFWACKNEHPQQIIVLTKTAGQQPGSGIVI